MSVNFSLLIVEKYLVGIEVKLVKEFKFYVNNVWIYFCKQIKKIVQLIEKFGFVNFILIDEINQILVGYGCVVVVKRFGILFVFILCIDYLSEDEKRVYMLVDN